MSHSCSACGFAGLQEAPRGKSGGGSYEICPACGFQSGVTDDDAGITPAQWRQRWLKSGGKWSSRGIQAPAGWTGGSPASAPRKKPRTA